MRPAQSPRLTASRVDGPFCRAMDQIAGAHCPAQGLAPGRGGVRRRRRLGAGARRRSSPFPLLWLTIPVLVWLIDGAAAREGRRRSRLLPAAVVGWCFGFGYFLAGLWWIGAAFLVDADKFAWLLPLAVVALPAGLALFWGLGAAVAALFWRDGWPRILVFAVRLRRGRMAARPCPHRLPVERLRLRADAGAGDDAVGLARRPLGADARRLHHLRRAGALWPADGPARRGAVGLRRLRRGALRRRISASARSGSPARTTLAAVARTCASSSRRSRRTRSGRPENGDEIVARYLELSERCRGGAGLDDHAILIWPESAFPFLLTDRPDALAAIADLLPDGTTLLTGAARAERAGGEPRSGVQQHLRHRRRRRDRGRLRQGPSGAVRRVPAVRRRGFDALRAFASSSQLPGGFSPGAARLTLAVPGAAARSAPLICYEIDLPRRRAADRRPAGLAPQRHQRRLVRRHAGAATSISSRPRCAPSRRALPLVRAANYGNLGDRRSATGGSSPASAGAAGLIDGDVPATPMPTRICTRAEIWISWRSGWLHGCCGRLPTVVAVGSRN